MLDVDIPARKQRIGPRRFAGAPAPRPVRESRAYRDPGTDQNRFKGSIREHADRFLRGKDGKHQCGVAPGSVTVHYRTPLGRAREKGDRAIITLPFSVLRHVETLRPFSRPKMRAIRQLRYDASAKIFFQCRRRFFLSTPMLFAKSIFQFGISK